MKILFLSLQYKFEFTILWDVVKLNWNCNSWTVSNMRAETHTYMNILVHVKGTCWDLDARAWQRHSQGLVPLSGRIEASLWRERQIIIYWPALPAAETVLAPRLPQHPPYGQPGLHKASSENQKRHHASEDKACPKRAA